MHSSDVIIVGGGCTGTSTAFHLAREGVNVTLIEKRSLGNGQTGHSSAALSAGVMSVRPRPPEQYSAAIWSLDFFRNFNEEVGDSAFYMETGWLSIVTAELEGHLEEYIARLKSLGIRIRLVSHSESSELVPGIQLNGSEVCIFDEDAGYADPMATIHGFSVAAEKLGVKILQNSEVIKIRLNGDNEIVGVETNEGSFDAPNLLLATGAWTNELLKKISVQIPVYSVRTEVGIIRKPPEIIGVSPIAIDYQNEVYWRPEGKDRFHVGFLHASINTSESEKQDSGGSMSSSPDDFDRGNSLSAIEDPSRRMVNRIPALSRGDWKGGYACVYDMTPDNLPIVDKISGYGGLYVASGFNGGGFHISPWVGKQMAEFIQKGARPTELLPFNAERFVAGLN